MPYLIVAYLIVAYLIVAYLIVAYLIVAYLIENVWCLVSASKLQCYERILSL